MADDTLTVVVQTHCWDATLKSATRGLQTTHLLRPDQFQRQYPKLVAGRATHQRADRPGEVFVPLNLGELPAVQVPERALAVQPGASNGRIAYVLVRCSASRPALWRLSVDEEHPDGLVVLSQGAPVLLERPVPFAVQYRPHEAATWTTLIDVGLYWGARQPVRPPRLRTEEGQPAHDARYIETCLREHFDTTTDEPFTQAVAAMAAADRSAKLEEIVARHLMATTSWSKTPRGGSTATKAPRCDSWSGWQRMVSRLQRIVQQQSGWEELDVTDYLLSALDMTVVPDGDRSVDTSWQISRVLHARGVLPEPLVVAARAQAGAS